MIAQEDKVKLQQKLSKVKADPHLQPGLRSLEKHLDNGKIQDAIISFDYIFQIAQYRGHDPENDPEILRIATEIKSLHKLHKWAQAQPEAAKVLLSKQKKELKLLAEKLQNRFISQLNTLV